MNNRLTMSVAITGLLGLGALAGTAYAAAPGEGPEAAALQGAKVSLSQAIASAEQQTGGRAYDAGVDTKGGQTSIIVETNGPKGVETVAIDAQSGGVISTHAGGETD